VGPQRAGPLNSLCPELELLALFKRVFNNFH